MPIAGTWAEGSRSLDISAECDCVGVSKLRVRIMAHGTAMDMTVVSKKPRLHDDIDTHFRICIDIVTSIVTPIVPNQSFQLAR
jgi:hypothetical protein